MSNVVERLIRYCRVSTQSNPANEAEVPSNPAEFDLARMLCGELLALGLSDAAVDEHAYVTAHLPASAGCEDSPCLALIAHIDTSPDAPATGVEPRIRHYEGGELVLGTHDGVQVTLNEENTPGLGQLAGRDLVCTDGSTLLGADDKAGVAEIMSYLALATQDSSIRHPRIAVCFAPDEEIGHGCSLLDVENFGATYGYTIDGDVLGGVEYECFNAASVTVHVRGHEIHPGSAKNIMVNALRVFGDFDKLLGDSARPEHTDGYEGFFHLCDVQGDCSNAYAHYIVRDHDRAAFEAKKLALLDAAEYLNKRWHEPRITVEIRDQYANMAEKVAPYPVLIDNAYKAFERIGVKAFTRPIRGGTDGAALSFRNLPCPNISTGGYNYHSVREFAVVDQMEAMVEFLCELGKLFAEA
jgi:tripeptide aminopeptidase